MKHVTVSVKQAFRSAGIALRRRPAQAPAHATPCELNAKHYKGSRVKLPGQEWRTLCVDCLRVEGRRVA